jgi:hypothetical protein
MNDAQRWKEVKARIAAGDKAHAKGDQHYQSAGILLKALKTKHKGTWAEWETKVKEKAGISTGRASELMQIADGRKTVAQLREGRAGGMRRIRAQRSSPRGEENVAESPAEQPVETVADTVGTAEGNDTTAEASADQRKAEFAALDDHDAADSADTMKAKFAELDAEADQDDDGDSEGVCWRRGLLNRATEAAGGALYEDWSSYVVDDELVAKAEQAAAAWTSTAEYLRRLRDAQSGRANVVTTLAADLAERAENATVKSPAAEPAEQPADVIEPDNGDGVLVWSSDQG